HGRVGGRTRPHAFLHRRHRAAVRGLLSRRPRLTGLQHLETPRKHEGGTSGDPIACQPTRTYPRDCRLTIVTIAQRSAWTPGSSCDGSTFFPMRPCPQTRSSTPASWSSFNVAMFGLSTPLCRAL